MMKKRILTALLVLVVLVGAVFAVNAEDTQDDTREQKQASAITGDSYTVNTDTILDLAGQEVIADITVDEGKKLYIKDSSDGKGKIIGSITGTWMSENGYVPLLIDEAYSFYKADFALDNSVTLRTDAIYSNGATIYFKGNIGGTNETINKHVAAYGVALRVADGEYFADGKAGGETYTRYAGWVNSDDDTVTELNSVELSGIMKRGNSVAKNKRNADLKIYCAPYVEINDQGDPKKNTKLIGTEIECTFKQLIEKIETDWDAEGEDDWVTYDHKAAVVTMNEAFSGVIPAWNYKRINSLVAPAASTTFEIKDAADLRLAGKSAVVNFSLEKDIDMSGVKDWTPITTLTGNFNGNGHTISNLEINTSVRENMGFICNVAEGASVTNLHLRDVTVNVPPKSVATAVGTIAGTNNGSITGVTVTGSLKDTRAGSEAAKIYAGVITGNNAGTVSVGNTVSVSNARDESGNLKMSITDDNGYVAVNESNLTVSGLAADAGLWLSETSDYVVRGGLVGSGNAVTSASTVIWSDRSYSTDRQAAELQHRRKLVEADIFEQGTIKWTPATTIKYWNDQTNNPNMEKPSGWWDTIVSGKWHIHNQTLSAGTTYYGIPYTHCATPIEQARYYLSEGANGLYTLKSEVTTIKGGANNVAGESTWTGGGTIGWGSYFGSDCSGGLAGAWHKVSPIITSNKTNSGVCLLYTTNMVPSQYNQWYYGFKQVGDYEVDDATWSGGEMGDPVVKETKKDADGNVIETIYWTNDNGEQWRDYTMDCDDIMAKIGATGFYDAYAQSQLGDIVVAYSRTGKVGHARMIAADPVVIRNGNNVIDADKSYFLFHEQGAGLYTSPGISSWRINWKSSFAEAAMQLPSQEMGGNGVGYYLPITMNAFHNTGVGASGGISTSGSILTGNDPIKYALNSSYRIMSATMVIKDADGNEVYNQTRFQGTSSSQARRRAVPGNIPLFASDVFKDCCDNLTEGATYYVTFSGTTYTGVTSTMMNNYKIVYTPTPES